MNAYEIPGLRFSLPAGAAIPRRRFVKVNSDSEGILATAGSNAIGVSMNETLEGEVLEVSDGIVMVEASAAIAAGALVSSTSDGRAVTASADAQSGTTPFAVTAGSAVIGTALTAASAAGEFVAVKI